MKILSSGSAAVAARMFSLSVAGGTTALIISLAVLGCTTGAGYLVDTHTQDDGAVVNQTVANAIELQSAYQPGDQCYLDVGRREHPDGNVAYYLRLTSIRHDWLNIHSQESLKLLIGSETVVLSGKGKPVQQRSREGGLLRESLEYPVTPDILHKLSGASGVRLIVTGGNGRLGGRFGIRTFNRVRRFVKTYADLHFFEVPAGLESGLNTRVFLRAGQRVSITARGVVSYDSGRHHTDPSGLICTAAGIPVADQERFKPVTYPHSDAYRTDGGQGMAGALFGWIGEFHKDAAFSIGGRREIKAARDGYLYLAVNDARGAYGDNQGEFRVTIRTLK